MSRAPTRARLRIASCLLFGVLAGCVPTQGGWDPSSLEASQPALAAFASQRLADTPPYFAPAASVAGRVVLFLCRWTLSDPLAVSLPEDADFEERASIAAAMRTWTSAGVGPGFRAARPGERANIEIRFTPEPDAGQVLVGTGATVADCALEQGIRARVANGRIAASLSFAKIELNRANYDLIGRTVPLEASELAGSALHELGHALGFSGHVAVDASVMSQSVERVRRIGRDVLAGEPVAAPTLRALYAVPSGVVVGRMDVPAERLEPLLLFARLAEYEGLRGPYVRVGDRSARVLWRDSEGKPLALGVRDWPAALRDPNEFRLLVYNRALALIRRAGERETR